MGQEERLRLLRRHAAPAQPSRHAARRCAAAAAPSATAAARARPRAGPGHLPAHHVHRRLSRARPRSTSTTCSTSSTRAASTTSAPSSTAPSRGRRRRSSHERRWRRRSPAAASGACWRRRSRSRWRRRQALVGRHLRGPGRRRVARRPSICSRGGTTAWRRRSTAGVLINDGSAPAGSLAEVEITDAFAERPGRPDRRSGGHPRSRDRGFGSLSPMQVVADALRALRSALSGGGHRRQLRRHPPRAARGARSCRGPRPRPRPAGRRW